MNGHLHRVRNGVKSRERASLAPSKKFWRFARRAKFNDLETARSCCEPNRRLDAVQRRWSSSRGVRVGNREASLGCGEGRGANALLGLQFAWATITTGKGGTKSRSEVEQSADHIPETVDPDECRPVVLARRWGQLMAHGRTTFKEPNIGTEPTSARRRNGDRSPRTLE
jgi:hypothetical protein